jgi:hypothetical protein
MSLVSETEARGAEIIMRPISKVFYLKRVAERLGNRASVKAVLVNLGGEKR